MKTRALVTHILAAKGLDTGGRILARVMALRLIHALRQQWKRGRLDGDGTVKGLAAVGIELCANGLIGIECRSNIHRYVGNQSSQRIPPYRLSFCANRHASKGI
jgi:hypothetical protein